MAKSLRAFLLLAVLVELTTATPKLPLSACTAIVAAPVSADSVCAYTTPAAAQVNCCARTAFPTSVTSCSSDCQKVYTEFLCKLNCVVAGNKICASASLKLYQACGTCSAFPAPKNVDANSDQQTIANAFLKALGYTDPVDSTVNCFDPTKTPTLCTAVTDTQDPTAVTLADSAALGTPLTTVSLGAGAKEYTLTATVKQPNGCNGQANNMLSTPLYGLWTATLGGQPIVLSQSKAESADFEKVGTTSYTTKATFNLNEYSLKQSGDLIVTFTSFNLAGSKQFTQKFSVTQPLNSLPQSISVNSATYAPKCSASSVLYAAQQDFVNDLKLGETQADRNCTIIGTVANRVMIVPNNGAGGKAISLLNTVPPSTTDAPNVCNVLTNIDLNAPQEQVFVFNCLVLQNTRINVQALNFPDQDSAAAQVANKPVVYMDGQSELKGQLQQFQYTFANDKDVTNPGDTRINTQILPSPLACRAKCDGDSNCVAYSYKAGTQDCSWFKNSPTAITIGDAAGVKLFSGKTSVITGNNQALKVRGNGKLTTDAGSTINWAVGGTGSLEVTGTSTVQSVTVSDQSTVVFTTAGGNGATTTITCAGNIVLSGGSLVLKFTSAGHILKFDCRGKVTNGQLALGAKFAAQQLQNCASQIQTSCSTGGISLPLTTSTASACFVAGSPNNNPDQCAGVKGTADPSAPLTRFQTAYLADNTGNGPILFAAGSRVFFYSVSPQFGALLSFLTIATDFNTFCGAGCAAASTPAQFVVSISANVDKGLVRIPLVYCISQDNAAMQRANCVGTKLPTVTVTNAGNRAYDLQYFNGDTINNNAALFPGLLNGANKDHIAVIALVLQPQPATSTGSGVTPDQKSDFYTVYLNQNLQSYPQSSFVANVLASSGVAPEFFTVTSYTTDPNNAAQIKVVFQCLDLASVDSANARCNNINSLLFNDATLNSQTKAVSSGGTQSKTAPPGDQSNGALFGLFALAIIPLLLIFAVVLFVVSKKRAADNQYSQDTSTFSTVAAQPYPNEKYYPSTPASYE